MAAGQIHPALNESGTFLAQPESRASAVLRPMSHHSANATPGFPLSSAKLSASFVEGWV